MRLIVLIRIASIISLLSFWTTAGLCQTQTGKKIDPLVGPVESITEWVMVEPERCDERTYLTTARNPSPGNAQMKFIRAPESKSTYNPAGLLIKYTIYKRCGGILYSDTNTYDRQGRLIRQRTTMDRFVYLPHLQISSFDAAGHLIATKGFNQKGVLSGGYLYRNDSQGRQIESKSYVVGSNKVFRNYLNRFVYDSHGYHVETTQYTYSKSVVTPDQSGFGYYKTRIANDEFGRPRVREYSLIDGTLVYSETTTYDERGNTLEVREMLADGSLRRKINYEYSLDDRGNWIKKIRREWTAEGVSSLFPEHEITERQIRYRRGPK